MEKQIMSEEERRFKVEKIDKFEKMISESEKNISKEVTFFGISILLFTLNLINYHNSEFMGIIKLIGMIININDDTLNSISKLINLACCGGSFPLIISSLKNILLSVSERTSSKTNLNMLQDELDLDEELGKQKTKIKCK